MIKSVNINKLSDYQRFLIEDKTIKILENKLEQNIDCIDASVKFVHEGQEYHAFYYQHTSDVGNKFWGCEVSEYYSHDNTISWANVVKWQWIKVE